MLRPVALNSLNATLTAAGTAAAKTQETRLQLSKGVIESINKKEVSSELSSTLVYRPLYNSLSFGLYDYIASSSTVTEKHH